MPKVRVSIGLPVYNGEKFVADAIGCVMSQTFSDWELIISDNASTDRTGSICQDFAGKDGRIRYYRNPRNLGVAPNYNRAFQLSSGQYFSWLAHDDILGPEFLESCLRAFEENPRAVLTFPRIAHVDANGRLLRRASSDLSVLGSAPVARIRRLIRLEIQSTDIFWCQFGLMRRDVLEQTSLMGLYNGSDQTMLFELALQGELVQTDKELFFRREHPQAATLRGGWTAKERAVFQYAGDQRKVVLPYCRMLKEHLMSIRRSSISQAAKMQCAAAVLNRFSKLWKYFAHEVLDTFRELPKTMFGRQPTNHHPNASFEPPLPSPQPKQPQPTGVEHKP